MLELWPIDPSFSFCSSNWRSFHIILYRKKVSSSSNIEKKRMVLVVQTYRRSWRCRCRAGRSAEAQVVPSGMSSESQQPSGRLQSLWNPLWHLKKHTQNKIRILILFFFPLKHHNHCIVRYLSNPSCRKKQDLDEKCVFRWLVLVALGQFDAMLNTNSFITSQLSACCCFRAVGLTLVLSSG